jgi:hypothetical protein
MIATARHQVRRFRRQVLDDLLCWVMAHGTLDELMLPRLLPSAGPGPSRAVVRRRPRPA